MNIKRLVPVTIVVVIIAFTVGLFSLKYNDKHKFISSGAQPILNIESPDGNVNIGPNRIEVQDGEDFVSIGWDGIRISDGDDSFSIGWNGINVREGNRSKFKFGNHRNFFSPYSSKLTSHSVNEEKFEDIEDISNISISSSFVDIKVKPEDRDDIRIHYHGNVRSNVLPKLKVEKQSNNVNIKLENPNTGSQVTSNSDIVLEVFVPKSFNGNFKATTSSGNISMEDLVGEDFHTLSSSGNQKLENIQANTINLSSSSGNIKVEDCIGQIKSSASSGNIFLDSANNSGNIQVSTSSGNVNILLPDNASYKIIGLSSSGRYNSNVNMNVEENEKGNFKATIGAGENSINISTSSGSTKFSKR